jgi:hypothetical protein
MDILFNLCSEIETGVYCQDAERISNAGQKLLEFFNSIKKENIWRLIPQTDDKMIPVVAMNMGALHVPYDPEALYLQPFLLSTVPVKFRKQADWLINEVSQMNGFMRMWNTLYTVLGTGGKVMLSCPILHKFKWWLLQFKSEPVIEKANGKFINKCDDAAFVIRVRLTINCLWWWAQPSKAVLRPVIEELWYFLFLDPCGNTLFLKNNKAPLIQTAFCDPASGVFPQWDSELSFPRLVRVDKFTVTDEYVLILRKEERAEAIKALKSTGLLNLTTAMLAGFATAPIDKDNMTAFSFAVFLEALTGYFRSDYVRSYQNDVSSVRETEAVENPPFEPHLRKVWRDFWMNGFKMPDKRRLYAIGMNALTTRSCGEPLDKIPQIKAEIKLKNRTVNMSYAANTKREFGYSDPDLIYSEQRLLESYTTNAPGRVFGRWVPARKDRKVLGGTTTRHVIEAVYVSQLQHYQAGLRRGAHEVTPLERDTGRYCTDHATWFRATSAPDTDVRLVMLLDFDAYDESERWNNVRRIMVDELKLAKAKIEGERYEMFGSLSPLEALLVHWYTLKDCVFQIDGGVAGPVQIVLDQLLSGEHGTLIINNATHMAYQDYYIEAMGSEFPFIFDQTSMQGDDEITLWRPINFLIKKPAEQAEIVGRLLDTLEKAASDNSMKISGKKTWARLRAFEYLKKMGMWGYVIPRITQLQLNEKERNARGEPPISRMRSRVGEFREWVMRGGDLIKALTRMHIEWALIRVVKGVGTKDSRITVEIPYEAMWAPQGKGGVGALPYNLMDPNVDALIEMNVYGEPVDSRIAAWVQASRGSSSSVEKEIASQLVTQFQKGVELIKKTDDPVRVENSLTAARQLRERYYSYTPGSATYANRHELLVREMIESTPRMQVFRNDAKLDSALQATKEYHALLADPTKITAWKNPLLTNGIGIVEKEAIEDKVRCAFVAGLDDGVQQWVNQLGTNSATNTAVNEVLRAFKLVTSDPEFPQLRGNQPEQLASTILTAGLLSPDAITLFLLERGGEAIRVAAAAPIISRNLQSALFVRDISNYSTSGDGWTDKSSSRISELVAVDQPSMTVNHPLGRVIHHIGYLYLRNQPMYSEAGVYLPRRKIQVSLTNLALTMWQTLTSRTDAAYASSIYV